jgi:ubiquitin-conjugating enzyme E2 Z
MARPPKRVMIDSQEIQEPPYVSQGIHYWFDEANMLEGRLLIWGPKDSVYEDMPMIYSVNFPATGYPFDPPKVLFLTTDGYTRFHPNMYREGKVCLSILGTWDGPKWAATMHLSTVAITLLSLMDNNPIVHEPGFENRKDVISTSYNDFVGYSSLVYLIKLIETYVNTKTLPEYMKVFEAEFLERLPTMCKSIQDRLDKASIEKVWTTMPYSMSGSTKYSEYRARFKTVVQKIEETKS